MSDETRKGRISTEQELHERQVAEQLDAIIFGVEKYTKTLETLIAASEAGQAAHPAHVNPPADEAVAAWMQGLTPESQEMAVFLCFLARRRFTVPKSFWKPEGEAAAATADVATDTKAN